MRVAFQEALFGATGEQKQALMESYPDLASIVDEEDDVAVAANEHSLVDQSAAGLTHLGEEDQTAFGELTTAYRDRFVFLLIVCVRDNPDRQHILDSGWARMHNSPTQERATALIEIANIANHRFDDFVADANPIHSARMQQFELS
jgi:2-oxo-4-hydroxy-4-carboxy--5-ureidoimidazoline (OHCU) decarboxylase